jgi:type I restriction enzyme R subunit
MPPPGKGWNEENLSENPAVEQLEALGYAFVSAEALEAERESLKEVVLTKRLAAALKRLNP